MLDFLKVFLLFVASGTAVVEVTRRIIGFMFG